MRPLLPAESSLFDQFGGLPIHPLVVHFAVVLLPVSALGLILLAVAPKLRSKFLGLSVLGLVGGTIAAFAAKESGEALATHVGLPAQHAFFGDLVVPVAGVTTLLAAIWWLLQKRSTGAATRVLSILASIGALASTGLTVAVGHSGAEAVWTGQLTPAASASATPTTTAALTLDMVKQHATATDCWTAINGTAYNLTDWIGKHPGGAAPITALCGTDGTAAYTAQHGTQSKPANSLAGYAIGKLQGSSNTSPTAAATSASAAPSPTASTYSLAEVKQHASQSSCWSAIDGTVYDLTQWVSQHPGGSRDILRLCGVDGTKAFHNEHGSEKRPNSTLAGFEIGTLS